jgi:hypothetical protein
MIEAIGAALLMARQLPYTGACSAALPEFSLLL